MKMNDWDDIGVHIRSVLHLSCDACKKDACLAGQDGTDVDPSIFVAAARVHWDTCPARTNRDE